VQEVNGHSSRVGESLPLTSEFYFDALAISVVRSVSSKKEIAVFSEVG
jgi:hypothetical protein